MNGVEASTGFNTLVDPQLIMPAVGERNLIAGCFTRLVDLPEQRLTGGLE
jgi:hypothetical protein